MLNTCTFCNCTKTGDFIELTAPDGRKIRVPKTSLFDVWNMKKKIRLKKDGTVARDSDSDAESIEIDSDGNMVTQPKTVTFADTSAGKWTGFATTPEPPLSPTQGGKIKCELMLIFRPLIMQLFDFHTI